MSETAKEVVILVAGFYVGFFVETVRSTISKIGDLAKKLSRME